MKRWIIYALIIVGSLFVLSLIAGNLYQWYFKGGGSVQQVTKAKDSRIVKGMIQKDYTVTHIHVYQKEEINAKIPEIPEAIKKDAATQYTAVKDVPPYEGTTRAIATMKEGTTDILLQKQPISLVALEFKGGIGARGGITTGGIGGDVFVHAELVRIERVHIGPYLELSTNMNRFTTKGQNPVEGKAMIQAEWKF